jgi:hypothetical protein
MRLYLDEDTAAGILFKLLVAAGHNVAEPVGESTVGQTDPMHLIHSIETGRAFVTHNFDDFEDLHDLVIAAGGLHPGILVIRKDNDSARDLSVRGIVNAIRKLEQSGQPIENEYHTLNHWR